MGTLNFSKKEKNFTSFKRTKERPVEKHWEWVVVDRMIVRCVLSESDTAPHFPKDEWAAEAASTDWWEPERPPHSPWQGLPLHLSVAKQSSALHGPEAGCSLNCSPAAWTRVICPSVSTSHASAPAWAQWYEALQKHVAPLSSIGLGQSFGQDTGPRVTHILELNPVTQYVPQTYLQPLVGHSSFLSWRDFLDILLKQCKSKLLLCIWYLCCLCQVNNYLLH